MPDKKLTDKEIVKALEEHYKQVDKGYSTHLEYGGKGDEHEEKYIYMLRDVLDLINRLQAEKDDLFYKLVGVMHSVDKWLDGDELKQDEVNRAATMREKTLQIFESLQAENEVLEARIGVYETCNARKDEAIKSLESRLKKVQMQLGDMCIMYHVIKAEAYKEVEEKLDRTTWYRINQKGELVVGANSETDIPLYKAEDVYNLLKELEAT